jgi:glutamate synthase domain-containing protein 2
MKKVLILSTILALCALASSDVVAQHGMQGGTPMTFFVTSEPIGTAAILAASLVQMRIVSSSPPRSARAAAHGTRI